MLLCIMDCHTGIYAFTKQHRLADPSHFITSDCGTTCKGFDMNIDYLLKLKADKSLTNEQIAELSGVPTSTIIRILSGRTDNPYFNTIVDIVRDMDGSVDVMENLKTGENAVPHKTKDGELVTLYRETIRNKERWIRFLVGVILGVFVVLLAIVAYDALQPMKGWIRY